MTIRNDNSIELELYNINEFNNKVIIRDFLLDNMKQENSGTKYRYFVEKLNSGNRIYIERPGRLNKGCDFVIFIENHILFNNNNDKPPKHEFLLEDLNFKKQGLSNTEWNFLLDAITSIYNCEPFETAFSKIEALPVLGEDFELILKLLRWFFIEQDITYWAKSGRQMLFNAINSI
ncbi:MAG: hypothetical protein JXL97_17535 [Bacteroidales bacterium]|nr:hypothetical protein [Bacteroidales bacterium]